MKKSRRGASDVDSFHRCPCARDKSVPATERWVVGLPSRTHNASVHHMGRARLVVPLCRPMIDCVGAVRCVRALCGGEAVAFVRMSVVSVDTPFGSTVRLPAMSCMCMPPGGGRARARACVSVYRSRVGDSVGGIFQLTVKRSRKPWPCIRVRIPCHAHGSRHSAARSSMSICHISPLHLASVFAAEKRRPKYKPGIESSDSRWKLG